MAGVRVITVMRLCAAVLDAESQERQEEQGDFSHKYINVQNPYGEFIEGGMGFVEKFRGLWG